MLRKKSSILFWFIFSICGLLSPAYCLAAFSLSVTPYEGGFDLRFGRVGSEYNVLSKEVNVNIVSDINKQYRLTQTLLQPLTSSQGVSIPQDKFVVYGLLGSNKNGTINVSQENQVSLSRGILYTSNQQGTSDSFVLVYSLKQPLEVPSGSYQGRISFTLEPIGSSQAPVTAILNIYADIESESSVDISTVSGANYISLTTAREDAKSADVSFNIKGNFGRQFTILQLLNQPFMSGSGDRLSDNAVYFRTTEFKKGSGVTRPTPVSLRRETIYTSDQQGGQDSFLLNYSLSEPENQKAGKYKAKIQYYIEGQTVQKPIGALDLEIEILPVFDLVITPELGGSIEFRNLKAKQPPQRSEMTIEVKSNKGKRYQVSQKLISELSNKEGTIIPLKNLTLREESIETKGSLRFSSPTEVKNGESVLFVSDYLGSSDKFRIIYELTPPADLKSGDYSSNITYSISEI